MFVGVSILAVSLGHAFSEEPQTSNSIIEQALISAQKGNRNETVLLLQKFKESVNKLELKNEQDLILFNNVAQLFQVSEDNDGTKKLYELATVSISEIDDKNHRDRIIVSIASIIARNGGNSNILIELSKLSLSPETTARTLFFAIMADSGVAPKSTWDDFLLQTKPTGKKLQPPNKELTTLAMKKVLEAVNTLKDVDIQLLILSQLSEQFSREPYNRLFNDAIEKSDIEINLKSYIVKLHTDKQSIVNQSRANMELINNEIIEAMRAVGDLDPFNPREIKKESDGYKKAKKLLDATVTKAKKLKINEGRSSIMYVITQTQIGIGDLDGARETLQIAIETEKKINKNDVLLEQLANLQVSVGDYEKAVNTTKSFYSSQKEFSKDRILYSVSKNLITSGKLDKAKEYSEQINDIKKRTELESSIKSAKDEVGKNTSIKKTIPEGFREWNSRNKIFKATAKFVSNENGTITLEKENGKKTIMKYADLCDEDQKYINEITKQIQPKK
jgi:tetratricopeptide (TPR) repeat protein